MSDLDLSVAMRDNGTIDKVKTSLRGVKNEAIATDRSIANTAKGSGVALQGQMDRIGGAASGAVSTIKGLAATIGIAVTASAALSKVFGEIDRQAQQIKEGIKSITSDMAGEAALSGMAGAGMIDKDVIAQMSRMKVQYTERGISLAGGQYTSSAAALASAAGIQGEDVGEAVKTAMELWARGGMQGTLVETSQNLAMTLATGQTRALRRSGVYLDETQFQDMDPEERTKAIFAALKTQLGKSSALDQLLNSNDPRAKLLISGINSQTAQLEYMERAAADNAIMKVRANEFRSRSFAEGVDPDSWTNPASFIYGRGIDPASGWFGSVIRFFDSIAFGSRSTYNEEFRRAIEIDTRPPGRRGT